MSMQMAELLYKSKPEVNSKAIVQRAQELLQSEIKIADEDSQDTLLFFHLNHLVQYSDAEVPAQTTAFFTDKGIDVEAYADKVQQSWQCPDAETLLQDISHCCLVGEMLCQGLEAQDRLRLYHGMLQAVVELTQPVAIAFMHSQQIVNSQTYLQQCEREALYRPGAFNIRFFNISNSDGDMLMDTRGLEEMGLHDLQCHFRDIEPNEVSEQIYNAACYIIEKGAVIESGHTLPGHLPDCVWHCQFEESLLEPKRELLDLNPGSPFAAGGRV